MKVGEGCKWWFNLVSDGVCKKQESVVNGVGKVVVGVRVGRQKKWWQTEGRFVEFVFKMCRLLMKGIDNGYC